METADTVEIGGDQLDCSPITDADIPRLHELSVAVSWPHRADDWALALALGTGWVARDQIGRVLCSAMWFPFSDTVASVGMVITSPRLQENGTGRWLMHRILAQTEGRARVLNATKQAYRLYVSLGFRTLAAVSQMNGIVGRVPGFASTARPMTAADHGPIHDLDSAAMGVARPAAIAAVLAVSEGLVIDRGSGIEGFALMRPFGRGRVIGPIVVRDEADALQLVGPFLAAHPGEFLRVDTRESQGAFRDFLATSGLAHFDTVQRMALGQPPEPWGLARTFGLINQALG